MSSTPLTGRYRTSTITLHWIMLLLLVAVYASIELRELFSKGSYPRENIKALHFMLGLCVLALVTLRVALRFSAPAPAPQIEPAPSRVQQIMSKLMHAALYGFMVGMPLAGWLYLSAKGSPVPFFGLELPALMGKYLQFAARIKEWHESVGEAGYWFIGLHAAAALFHHHVIKDNTLRRMLPSRG